MAQTKPLRICFITVEFHGLFKNGGIGTANTGLALALAAQGFAVTVAIANADAAGPSPSSGSYAELQAHYARQGIKLEHVPPIKPECPRAVSLAVYEYVRKQSFDIVMFNDNGGQGFYTMLAKRTGLMANAPLLCVVAHGPLDWVAELNAQEHFHAGLATTYMEQTCAGLADLLVSPSRYLLDWMIARNWVKPGQGHVVQNIVGDAARPPALPQSTKRRVDEVIFFGRQETRKGLDLFCDAIDLLDAAQDLGNVRITFLGKFSKSAWMHSGIYLAERARHWRATLRVLTEYDQPEALQYLRRPGALAVIPSRAENSPCVVAECLIQGVPFLASAGGGTAELIAASDQETCLFTPTAPELAARLRTCLSDGQMPGQLAIQQHKVLKQWVDLLRMAHAKQAKPSPAALPSFSICLAWNAAPAFAATLNGLRNQSLVPLEIIIAGLDDATFAAVSWPGLIKLKGAFTSRGVARNEAAARARGDYLCFIDESCAVPQAGALAAFALAVARTGADIVTAMAETPDHPLPVGACAELGLSEPCFGTGMWAVSRTGFIAQGGFAPWRDAVLDWAYLARAVLEGKKLELVPTQSVHLQGMQNNSLSGSSLVDDVREVRTLYAAQPMGRFPRLIEAGMNWADARRRGQTALLAALPAASRPLAQKLVSMDPNSRDARGIFVAYCSERRLPDLALDYAMHNGTSLLPDAVSAALKINEDAARRRLGMRDLALSHRIDLTAELAPRARAFYGMSQRQILAEAGGLLRHTVPDGLGVIKLPGACPPGSASLNVTAICDAGEKLQIGALLCHSAARLRLTPEGLASGEAASWSGWLTPQAGHTSELSLHLREPATETLDLYFVTRKTGSIDAQLVWQCVEAELCLNGDVTPSKLEVVETTIPVSPEQLTKAEVLTDLTGVKFSIYYPGPPSLLHPLPDRLAAVRLKGLLPAASAGLQCSVSLGHEKSHPVEFAMWLRPLGSPAILPQAPEQEPFFSGWRRCTERNVPRPVSLRLPENAVGPFDLYLATRVVDQPNVDFCHALWHDLSIIERSATGPAAARALAAPAVVVSSEHEAPVQSYIICAAARTGSNLLASSLRRIGIAGWPYEYFNAHTRNDGFMLEELGIAADISEPPDFSARLPQILRSGTRRGVFGTTLHWADKEYMLTALRRTHKDLADLPPLELMQASLPRLRFIWLSREDKLAQAVSHYRAIVSGIWQKDAADQSSGPAPVIPFDDAAISQLLEDAEVHDKGWRDFFGTAMEHMLHINYEDLADNYASTMGNVLGFLGLNVPPQGFPAPRYQRQADAISAQLIAHYRQALSRKTRPQHALSVVAYAAETR